MSVLHRISSDQRTGRGSVIFVHGLAGDPFASWQADGDASRFWPAWLASDLSKLAIYSLGYDADASNWFGHALQLPDRATDVLAELVSYRVDEAPIVFICHSLGGLLVKQLLRIASDQRGSGQGGVFDQTRGVIFLGTPNAGSHLANWVDRFRILFRPSEATASLAANDAHLRDLNIWYRDRSLDAGITTLVFFETKPTKSVMVVEAMSADPGLPRVRPIPVDADHLGVCKPASRDTTLYRTVVRFVEDALQKDDQMRRLSAGYTDRPVEQEKFDVFISHSSTQKAWVEALADNLQRASKRVFLDLWRLVPGQDWVEGLRAGLASCRSAILVVSPEAYHSGWVREEYEILKRRQATNPDFFIIPVIHSEVEGDMPFKGSIQWVDFRDPAKHLESFARLLAGLERRSPGPRPIYDSSLWTSLPQDPVRPLAEAGRRTIEDAFAQLFNAQAVVILAQEGLGSGAITREIKRRAVERFGHEAVCQVTPSYVTTEEGLEPYFESLLAQMNLPVESASALTFQRQLSRRLESGDPLCLLFNGVEHSPRPALEKLCGALRALNEKYDHLRVLMCGGERLCEMRYAMGALSYLSHAHEELWPDPGASEIQAEASAQGVAVLEPGALSLLNELSGGHFGLLRELIGLIRSGERGRELLTQAVYDSPTIWAAVAPLREYEDASRFLADAVQREELGKAERFIRDSTLRRMYWLSLVARRKTGSGLALAWRSPAIREAARRIVAGA